MTDYTFQNLANPAWVGSLIDGLFKWTDTTTGEVNTPVYLKANGPPIEVGKAGATPNYIGQLASKAAQGDICKVQTPFAAIYAFVAGGTITRGNRVKLDSNQKVVAITYPANAALNSTFSDTEVEAALDALRDAIAQDDYAIGKALQSASNNDVIYVGVTA